MDANGGASLVVKAGKRVGLDSSNRTQLFHQCSGRDDARFLHLFQGQKIPLVTGYQQDAGIENDAHDPLSVRHGIHGRTAPSSALPGFPRSPRGFRPSPPTRPPRASLVPNRGDAPLDALGRRGSCHFVAFVDEPLQGDEGGQKGRLCHSCSGPNLCAFALSPCLPGRRPEVI